MVCIYTIKAGSLHGKLKPCTNAQKSTTPTGKPYCHGDRQPPGSDVPPSSDKAVATVCMSAGVTATFLLAFRLTINKPICPHSKTLSYRIQFSTIISFKPAYRLEEYTRCEVWC